MDTLLKDLTYAVRGLRKNLGFSTVAAVTIALAWRLHLDLQRRERRAAAAAAVFRRAAPGDGVG
jgi:hypothetical protein